MGMKRDKLLIECPAFFFQHAHSDLHACIAQHLYAAAMYLGEGIFAAHNNARYVAVNNQFGTWRGPAVMRTRFKTHVDRGFLQERAVFGPHAVDSIHLSMCLPAMDMIALTDDSPLTNDDSSHHRVGSSSVLTLAGQLETAAHIVLIRAGSKSCRVVF